MRCARRSPSRRRPRGRSAATRATAAPRAPKPSALARLGGSLAPAPARRRGGIGTPVKAVLRKLKRWYVEPLAYDQRSFNAATLRLIDDLQEQVDGCRPSSTRRPARRRSRERHGGRPAGRRAPALPHVPRRARGRRRGRLPGAAAERTRSSTPSRGSSTRRLPESPRRRARRRAGRDRARPGLVRAGRRGGRRAPVSHARLWLGRPHVEGERALVRPAARPARAGMRVLEVGAAKCWGAPTSSRRAAPTSGRTSSPTRTSGSGAARSTSARSDRSSACRPTARACRSRTARSTSPTAWRRSITRSTSAAWWARWRA